MVFLLRSEAAGMGPRCDPFTTQRLASGGASGTARREGDHPAWQGAKRPKAGDTRWVVTRGEAVTRSREMRRRVRAFSRSLADTRRETNDRPAITLCRDRLPKGSEFRFG